MPALTEKQTYYQQIVCQDFLNELSYLSGFPDARTPERQQHLISPLLPWQPIIYRMLKQSSHGRTKPYSKDDALIYARIEEAAEAAADYYESVLESLSIQELSLLAMHHVDRIFAHMTQLEAWSNESTPIERRRWIPEHFFQGIVEGKADRWVLSIEAPETITTLHPYPLEFNASEEESLVLVDDRVSPETFLTTWKPREDWVLIDVEGIRQLVPRHQVTQLDRLVDVQTSNGRWTIASSAAIAGQSFDKQGYSGCSFHLRNLIKNFEEKLNTLVFEGNHFPEHSIPFEAMQQRMNRLFFRRNLSLAQERLLPWEVSVPKSLIDTDFAESSSHTDEDEYARNLSSLYSALDATDESNQWLVEGINGSGKSTILKQLHRHSFESNQQLLPILIDFRQIDVSTFNLTLSFLKHYVMRRYGYTEVDVNRFFDEKKMLWLIDNIDDCSDVALRWRLLSGEEEGLSSGNTVFTARPGKVSVPEKVIKQQLLPWDYHQTETYLTEKTPVVTSHQKTPYAPLVIQSPTLQTIIHTGEEPLIQETSHVKILMPRNIAASPQLTAMLSESLPYLLKKPKTTWPKTARELYDFYGTEVLGLSLQEKEMLKRYAIASWLENNFPQTPTRTYPFLSPVFSTLPTRYTFTEAGWQDYWIAEALWEDRHNPAPDSLWNQAYWTPERPEVFHFLKERFAQEPDGLTSAQQLWHQWVDTESYKILYNSAPAVIPAHCLYIEIDTGEPNRLKYTFNDTHQHTQSGYLTQAQLGHDYEIIKRKIEYPESDASPFPPIKVKIMAAIQENGHMPNADKARYNVSALLRDTTFHVEQQGAVFINPSDGLPMRWANRESSPSSNALTLTDVSPVVVENQQAYVISRSNREMRLAMALNLDDEAQFKLYGNLKYPVGIAGHACHYMDEAGNINGRHFIAVSNLDRDVVERLRDTLFREMWEAKDTLDLNAWVPAQWGIYEKALHDLHLQLNNEALYYSALERYTYQINFSTSSSAHPYPVLEIFLAEERAVFEETLKHNPIYHVHEDPERDSIQPLSQDEINIRWKRHEQRLKAHIVKFQEEMKKTDAHPNKLEEQLNGSKSVFRVKKEGAENQAKLIKEREEKMFRGSCDRFRLLSEAYEVTRTAYQAYPSAQLIMLQHAMGEGNLTPAIHTFQSWFALNAESDFVSILKENLWQALSQWMMTEGPNWLRSMWPLGGRDKAEPVFFSGNPAAYRQFFHGYSVLLQSEVSTDSIKTLEDAWKTGGIAALETLFETDALLKEGWSALSEVERQALRQDMALFERLSEHSRKAIMTGIVTQLSQNVGQIIDSLAEHYHQQWLTFIGVAIENYTQTAGTHKNWQALSSEQKTLFIQQLSTAILSPESLKMLMMSQPILFPQISDSFIERFLRLGLGVDIANKNHESGLFLAIRAVIHHQNNLAKQKKCYEMVAHWANCGATVGIIIETASRERPYCSLLAYLREQDLGTVEWKDMMQALNGIHIVFEQHARGEKALQNYTQEIKKIVAAYDQKYQLAGFTSLAAMIQYFSLMAQPILIKHDRQEAILIYPREAGLLLLNPYELLVGIKRMQERYTNFEKRSLGSNHSALHNAIRECTEEFIETVELGEYLALITPASQQALLPRKYQLSGSSFSFGSWFSGNQRRQPSVSVETNDKLRNRVSESDKKAYDAEIEKEAAKRLIDEKNQEIEKIQRQHQEDMEKVAKILSDNRISMESVSDDAGHRQSSDLTTNLQEEAINGTSINPILPMVVEFAIDEASEQYLPCQQPTLTLVAQESSESIFLTQFVQRLGLHHTMYNDELESFNQLAIHFSEDTPLITEAGSLFLLQHPETGHIILALEPVNGRNVEYLCQVFHEGNQGRQFVFLPAAVTFLEERRTTYASELDLNYTSSTTMARNPLVNSLRASSARMTSAGVMHHSTHFRTQEQEEAKHTGLSSDEDLVSSIDSSQGIGYNGCVSLQDL